MPSTPMPSTLERLRRLQRLRTGRATSYPTETNTQKQPAAEREIESAPIEALVEGTTVENEAGRCFLVTQRYPLNSLPRQTALGNLLHHDPSLLAPLYPDYGLDHCPGFRTAAFLDIESTGLGGGAGIYAFMVGIGTFEQEEKAADGSTDRLTFVVRQFFMRHPGEEPALLTAVADLLRGCQSLVTFNGRSFDAPLLRGRYGYASRSLPADIGAPPTLASNCAHLDLLHPARRLWRKRLRSCALSNLERTVLCHARTEADVPGHLIPQLYTDYLRDGDGRMMQGVFYHNSEDILSMAVLAEVIYSVIAHPPQTGPAHLQPLDLLSLARLQMDLGRPHRAETLYRAALDQLDGRAPLAEAFNGLGLLLKRQRRGEEAVAVWEQWLTTVRAPENGPDSRPYVELAKFHEWQSGDLAQAAMWTQWALHEQEQAPAHTRFPQTQAETQAELCHRLARLQRKLNRSG